MAAGSGRDARSVRVRAPLGAAAGTLVLVLALQLRDPHEQGSWGLCPLHALTGLDCPLCGGLRAVHNLGRGQAAAAAGSNALVVLVLVPLALVLWTRWLRASWAGPRRVRLAAPSGRVGLALLVAAGAFALVRNLPVAAWLAS